MYAVTSSLLHRLQAIDTFANDIEETSFNLVACRHSDRMSEADHLHTASKTVGRVHGYGAHGVLTDVLLHLGDEFVTVVARYL